MPHAVKPKTPFYRFNSSPEIIRLSIMYYAKFPLSLRNVEDLLHERGIDLCHETVRFWCNRFVPMFAAEIRKKRVDRMRQHTHWRWHLDEVYVKINGEAANKQPCVEIESHDVPTGVMCSPPTMAGAFQPMCWEQIR